MIARRLLRKVLPKPVALAIRREWLARAIVGGRAYVEGDVAVLPRLVRSSDTCWDIGANSGMYTLPLSRLAGRVLAFEPVPHNFEILQRVIARAGLSNVHAQRLAIADVAGSARMAIPIEGFYGGYYMSALDDTGDVAVDTATVDGLIAAGAPEPSFIKCDVEGAEERVIAGARELIARRHPVWLLETFRDDVVALMQSLGYTAYVHAGGQKLRRVSAREPQNRNYLFLGDEHAL